MSEIIFGAYCDGGTHCPSWHKLKSHFEYIGTPYCPLFPTHTPGPGAPPIMAPTAATELHNKRWESLSVDDKFIVGLLQRAADITARFTTDIRFTGVQLSPSLDEAEQ